MSFAENLKRLMLVKMVSIDTISMDMNVGRVTVWRWVNDLSVPNIHMSIKLSEYLHVTLTDLSGLYLFVRDSEGVNPLKQTSDETELLKNCGNDLRIHMEEKAMSHQDLADELDVSVRTVYGWTSGARWPTLYLAIRMCNLFKVAPVDLWDYGR